MDLVAVRAMPADDQVTYLVGAVSREAVELEGVLRAIFPLLGSDAPRDEGFARLVNRAEDLIRGYMGLDEAARAHSEEMLTEARQAYQSRNRQIHDLLVAYTDQSVDRFRFGRLEFDDRGEPIAARISIDELVDLRLNLMHATWRLRGLYFRLNEPTNTQLWRMLLSGRFKARWDGSAGFLGVARS